MANDSNKFRTAVEMTSHGFDLQGNHFLRGDERFVPLYEAKLFHHFNHRYNTFAGITGKGLFHVKAFAPEMSEAELKDPNSLPLPRYWVSVKDVESATSSAGNVGYLIAFRDITNVSTNRRTAIFSALPYAAVGHTSPLILLDVDGNYRAAFLSIVTSFAFDYVLRQKIGGTHLTYGYLKQLPVIPPYTYTQALLDFISVRVLELTFTAWDLQAFARDLDYHGAPFVWDEERRFLMRCELDAFYFHLYGIDRADVDYIMETFPIIKRKDEAAHGEYLTKRVILEMYNQMAALPTMLVPAPKEEQGEIAVPDVSRWVSPLDPPPADPRAAHEV